MNEYLMKFVRNESGAVTVDWVVLTAGLVGLGLAVGTVVASGLDNATADIEGELRGDGFITTAFVTPKSAAAHEATAVATGKGKEEVKEPVSVFSADGAMVESEYEVALLDAKEREPDDIVKVMEDVLTGAKSAIADSDPKKAAALLSYATAYGVTYEDKTGKQLEEPAEIYASLTKDFNQQFPEYKF